MKSDKELIIKLHLRCECGWALKYEYYWKESNYAIEVKPCEMCMRRSKW
jgi:hypothetical protein